VSVVIPVFNQAEYVEEAIESVLAQDYPRIELIVIDDGSTDDTPRRLAAYEGRATILRQPNRGASVALNRGIRQSQGPLVCWLSADDVFLPGKVARQVAAFRQDPGLALTYTGYERIRDDGSLIERIERPPRVDVDPFTMVFWRNAVNGSSVKMRREVYDATGGFDETLRADVDADMWLRVAERHRIACLDGVYLKYRIHANTLSADVPLMIASMTEVRRRFLRSGALRRRLGARHSTDVPRVLSWMAADFARQGLRDLSIELLAESRAAGRDLPAQLIARLTLSAIDVSLRSRFGAWATWPLRTVLHLLRTALSPNG